MKNIYLIFITLLTIILILILVIYNIYSKSYQNEKISDYISKNIELFNENLDIEKKYALSLSLLISQNNILKKSLVSNNQKLALIQLDKILLNIKKSVNINNIDIQLHTKNLEAFARSWDKSNYIGKKLESFRKGLVIVKKTKEPFVSIELGKRLNIKAISPILDNNSNFIGSIEVIMDFKNIKKILKKFNISMMVLLDKEFINIAVDLKKNKKINKYYIIDNDYDKKLLNKLVYNPNILKNKEFYTILDKNIIVVLPLKSIGINDVGVIVLDMNYKDDEFYFNYKLSNKYYENNNYSFDKNKKREVVIK